MKKENIFGTITLIIGLLVVSETLYYSAFSHWKSLAYKKVELNQSLLTIEYWGDGEIRLLSEKKGQEWEKTSVEIYLQQAYEEKGRTLQENKIGQSSLAPPPDNSSQKASETIILKTPENYTILLCSCIWQYSLKNLLQVQKTVSCMIGDKQVPGRETQQRPSLWERFGKWLFDLEPLPESDTWTTYEKNKTLCAEKSFKASLAKNLVVRVMEENKNMTITLPIRQKTTPYLLFIKKTRSKKNRP